LAGLLERVEAVVALKAFYSPDLLAGCVRDRDLAAADWLSVDQNCAGATPAAKINAIQ
jgi:hypothetical protein